MLRIPPYHLYYLIAPAFLILLGSFVAWDYAFNEASHVAPYLPFSRYNDIPYDVYSHNSTLPPRISDFPKLVAHLEENRTALYINNVYERWELVNEEAYTALAECLTFPARCRPNQQRIIIFGSSWVKNGVVEGWRGGEGVWGRSMHDTLKQWGYTLIFGQGRYEEIAYQYQLFPSLVVAVFGDNHKDCYYNGECIKTSTNPDGIPIWKLFEMNYFPGLDPHETFHPAWQITAEIPLDYPEDRSGESYLGFSIEDECIHHRYIPSVEREQRAYILAKRSDYFEPKYCQFPLHFFGDVKNDLGINLLAGYRIADDFQGPPEVENVGMQSPEDYHGLVASSKMLIGLGLPRSSPSPWVALCQGVPFLNPIYYWDPNEPDNCQKWFTQHDSMRCMKSPYVYNVRHGNYTEFRDSIEHALNGEIEKFIPEWMTQKAMDARMLKWVTTDWKSLGAAALSTWEQRAEEGLWRLDRSRPQQDWVM